MLMVQVLKALKDQRLSGEIGAHVHVVEFQKRGTITYYVVLTYNGILCLNNKLKMLSVVCVSLFFNMLLHMCTIVLHRSYHMCCLCAFDTFVMTLLMTSPLSLQACHMHTFFSSWHLEISHICTGTSRSNDIC